MDTVELKVEERVAWITLNRPDALNALTLELGRDLTAAVDRVAGDAGVRAVVITGAGRGFSAGADLREGLAPGDTGKLDLSKPLRETFHPLVLRLRTLEKPVIAAVNGGAVGIGCSLALSADIVIAAESSYFLLAFGNIGLGLDGGASAFLVSRIGYARAAEMAMLAERIGAPKALEWGLVNRLAPDGDLLTAAGAVATKLAAGSPGSYAAMKRTLNLASFANLREVLGLEAALQRERGDSADFMEGIAAFLEKRPAEFTGN